jgi:hypothetical protein
MAQDEEDAANSKDSSFTLRCAVCAVVPVLPSLPIFKCSNGHLLCEVCFEKPEKPCTVCCSPVSLGHHRISLINSTRPLSRIIFPTAIPDLPTQPQSDIPFGPSTPVQGRNSPI